MPSNKPAHGFTLLEVLVALVIVGTALGASLRAMGSLTQNSAHLRTYLLATWSAENQLTQLRMTRAFPPLGKTVLDCGQDDIAMQCERDVSPSPNPNFRRVEISVMAGESSPRRILKLTQVVRRE